MTPPRASGFEYRFSGLSVPAYFFRPSTFPARFPPVSSYAPSSVARFEGVFVRFSLARHPRGELKQCGFSPGTFGFGPSAFASFALSSRGLVFLPETLFVGKKRIKRIAEDAGIEFFLFRSEAEIDPDRGCPEITDIWFNDSFKAGSFFFITWNLKNLLQVSSFRYI